MALRSVLETAIANLNHGLRTTPIVVLSPPPEPPPRPLSPPSPPTAARPLPSPFDSRALSALTLDSRALPALTLDSRARPALTLDSRARPVLACPRPDALSRSHSISLSPRGAARTARRKREEDGKTRRRRLVCKVEKCAITTTAVEWFCCRVLKNVRARARSLPFGDLARAVRQSSRLPSSRPT